MNATLRRVRPHFYRKEQQIETKPDNKKQKSLQIKQKFGELEDH